MTVLMLLMLYAVTGILLIVAAGLLVDAVWDRLQNGAPHAPAEDDFEPDLRDHGDPLLTLQISIETLRQAIASTRAEIRRLEGLAPPVLGRWDRLGLELRRIWPQLWYVLPLLGGMAIAAALAFDAVSVWALAHRPGSVLDISPVRGFIAPGATGIWHLAVAVILAAAGLGVLYGLSGILARCGTKQLRSYLEWLQERDAVIPKLQRRAKRLDIQRAQMLSDWKKAVELHQRVIVRAFRRFHERPGESDDLISFDD